MAFKRKIKSKFLNKVTPKTNKPSPRSNHCLFTYKNLIYMFGGRVQEECRTNTLFTFNPKTSHWEMINTRGAVAPRCSACSFTLSPELGKAFLLGGIDENHDYLQTLFVYDLSDQKWEQLEKPPFLFVDHSAVWMNGKLWVVGGEEIENSENFADQNESEEKKKTEVRNLKNDNVILERPPNSVAVYDYLKRKWDLIVPIDKSGFHNYVSSQSLCCYQNKLISFGGSQNDEAFLNDIWIFSVDKKKWKKIGKDSTSTSTSSSSSPKKDQKLKSNPFFRSLNPNTWIKYFKKETNNGTDLRTNLSCQTKSISKKVFKKKKKNKEKNGKVKKTDQEFETQVDNYLCDSWTDNYISSYSDSYSNNYSNSDSNSLCNSGCNSSGSNQTRERGGGSLLFRGRATDHDNEKSSDECNDYPSFGNRNKWPGERMGHCAAIWENKMVVISGYHFDTSQFYDDFWIYDFPTKTWEEIPFSDMNNEKSNIFSGRIRGKITLVDNSIYYIGGYQEEYLMDVWKFKIKQTTLEQDLKNLYSNRQLCDWSVISKENVKIEAHSSLLSTRFRGTHPKKIQSILNGRRKKIIDNIVLWCYTGKLDFANLTKRDCLELDRISKKIFHNNKSMHHYQKCDFFQNNLSINDPNLVAKDIGKLFLDQNTSDFTILVNNEKIYVHKWLLIMRSELYRGMFNYVDKSLASVNDYSKKTFQSVKDLIQFLYTNDTSHIKSLEIAQELFDAIEYYGLHLKSEIGTYISNLL
ncbi:hypothetical protein M0813_21673 [Anaeramoeba flamelloides]|uniref:BTB domain-containing protein n=1 Tax=Anaeramoeba flamelloides TaxID=1746091 RepID=A0ABQ8YHA4_9EUKA|nr:hypothetical protein M0813_21673 [Anaeramoeba flamelloides]